MATPPSGAAPLSKTKPAPENKAAEWAPTIKIHDMSRWASKWAPRDKDGITDLITHHTCLPANSDPSEIDAAELSQGSYGAGYNYVIQGDGTIIILRPISVMPAAAYGRNRQSINIALNGNFHAALPTDAQKRSWLWLCSKLVAGSVPYAPDKFSQEKFEIQNCIRHRDVALRFYPDNTADYASECPGDRLSESFQSQWVHELNLLSKRHFK